ncbi:MAG: AAA family ATPase [Desulfobacterales bacterium]
MYKQFFGFKERPFKLVPNPDYLFLSRVHEEALAHLNYAVSEGEGFVLITGEVGTGKTTLCRSFLEGLDDNVKSAFIFNPKLDAIQLLRAINDEFGIDSTAVHTKNLIDELNAFLIEQKRNNKKVILLIDEAQNLNLEVLEQVRLLSNLETTQEKLLQIILVGQPELGEMLDSPELRQLGQRITLNCHLRPFDLKETGAYIAHRINIASVKPQTVFTKRAVSAIYKHSGGIPRKINIICDRALLTGFGLDERTIGISIIRSAIGELSGKASPIRPWYIGPMKVTALGLILCGVLFLVLPNTFFKASPPETAAPRKQVLGKETSPAPEPKIVPAGSSAAPVVAKKGEKRPPTSPTTAAKALSIEERLNTLDPKSSRREAMKTVMAIWGRASDLPAFLSNVDDDGMFFRLAAKQAGFNILPVTRNIRVLKKLNLPAALALQVPGRPSPVYLTLSRLEDGFANLKHSMEEPEIRIPLERLNAYWSGSAYVPWKDFYGYNGLIPANATEESILTLKMHIRDIGYDHIEFSPYYDKATFEAVKMIQHEHGLLEDGLVGPLTTIILYNQLGKLDIPKLSMQTP